MVWVDASDDVQGGGTEFPYLQGKWADGSWCEFLECPTQDEKDREEERLGTTFRVKPGNAVYWENFGADGRGREETWHAGLPVTRGTKVGLNIWSFGRIE